MRKLLILMLVLGMAPLACATVSLVSTGATVGITETATIQVSSDTDSVGWTGYLGYTHANAAITSAWAETIAGSDAAANPSPGGYVGYYQLVSLDLSTPTDSIQAGIQFEGLAHGTATGSYDFYLWDQDWDGGTLLGTFTLTVIPEPVTIALLGLGGLLLRRRK